MSVSSTPSPTGTAAANHRARVAARTRLDFWFDAVILVGYMVAYSYGWTGVVIHEWLGIGLGIALLLHLTLHWDWVVRTTRRLVSPRGHDKLIWLVNLALLFAMTLCVASGIAISRVALPELGLYTLQSPFWFRLHALTAEITVGLVPIHVALRWRWILGVNVFAVRGHVVKGRPPGKLAAGGKLPGAVTPLSAGAVGNLRSNDGSGIPGLMLGDLLEPVNLAVLRNTVFLEAAVIAAVVLADAGYRRLRWARRAG